MTVPANGQTEHDEPLALSLCCQCHGEALSQLIQSIGRSQLFAQLSGRDRARLHLVIEELVTNTIKHGDVPAEAFVSIELEIKATELTIDYFDSGTAFNPLEADLPEPEKDSRAGFGWRLIKGICSSLAYARKAGRNQLKLVLPLS